MSADSYDVAIVGGGLVGCSLAVALATQRKRVALIEAFAAGDESPSWDERCIALNAASRRILDDMGLWEALAAHSTPILSTHISERGRFGAARFTAEQAGVPALGYNTPLRAINQLLWSSARAAGVSVFCPARLSSLHTLADQVDLRLHTDTSDAVSLRTRLLVAADGARSAVRERLEIKAQTRDYGQSALVTAVRPQHAHGGVAYERFLDTGPLALLPKPDDAQGHACSLVWTLPTERIAEVMALDDAAFRMRAHTEFGERVGHFMALGRRQTYPLMRVMSERISAPRTVLIGNAAQSLHPVAAQGFNLGLRDAATLAELLDSAADPGQDGVLTEYVARRTQDRDRVSAFTDQLVRVFSNRAPGLRGLRHLGLLLLELDTPARHGILRQNLGFGTALPQRARH
ncbi:MAG: 2-octaprenyl-6-methoxyphenyl hydroxylase [Panacagrimonas sp.]